MDKYKYVSVQNVKENIKDNFIGLAKEYLKYSVILVDNRLIHMNNCKKYHLCICPKCRIKHKKRLFWSGNGIPRIYCKDCRQTIFYNDYDYQEQEYTLSIPKNIKRIE